MSSVTQSPIQAKYVHVYDEPATIVKVGEILYVVFDDSRIERFTIEMAPFVTLLGDCQLADDQALLDRIAGGYAAGACSRTEGRS